MKRESPITFPNLEIRRQPFAHAVKETFLPDDLYGDLRQSFPECPRNNGPTGYTLYSGDPEYDQLVATHPGWQALYETTHCQDFIAYCARQFGAVCEEAGCRINLAKSRYVDYIESRADKESRHISHVTLEPDELWVRTDIMQGRVGYSRRPHLDHRRRVVTFLIYFTDALETMQAGGELVLLGRVSLNSFEPVVVRPSNNLMIAFPCANDSIHSVAPITSQAGKRNFVQITVSSSVDVWPQDSVAASLATRLRRALGGM